MTDNQILRDGRRIVLPIVCEQNKARKCVPTEADLIRANTLGFGDDIGSITNKITAMTEIQSLFEPGSEEYETLAYRITAGQQIQQNSIDSIVLVVTSLREVCRITW